MVSWPPSSVFLFAIHGLIFAIALDDHHVTAKCHGVADTTSLALTPLVPQRRAGAAKVNTTATPLRKIQLGGVLGAQKALRTPKRYKINTKKSR